MGEFALQSDPAPLTSGQLARRYGVSPQTVANWRKAGMPARDAGGRFLYDPADCDRWVGRNTGGARHGGRRAGAGRKRTRVPADRRITAAVEIADARARARERQAEFVHVDDLLQVTHRELLTLVALEVEESGLDKTKLERLKLLLDARIRRREALEAEGRLVDAEEASAAFAAALASIRDRLDQLPARLLRAVMLALGDKADSGDEPAVLAVMTGAVDALAAELGGDK